MSNAEFSFVGCVFVGYYAGVSMLATGKKLKNIVRQMAGQFITARDNMSGGITLQGDWVLANLRQIQKELRQIGKDSSFAQASIRANIDKMDTSGARILMDFQNISGLQDWQKSLIEMIAKATQAYPDPPPVPTGLRGFLISIGQSAYTSWNNLLDLLRFIGETCVYLASSVIHPRRLRVRSILRHIHETGIMALPIVSLIAFLISIVLAYQGAGQLQRFGAEIFTINMVAISVLREMGVLLTAIMVAGRSGSAFTAEIGVMKVNEEIDAMKIMGIRPFEFLVIPRLIALMITLPCLTFVADIMGLLGGGIIAYFQLDISPIQYLDRAHSAIGPWDFWVGIIKAPVFAFMIAVVGCMRGMQVSGSAESVGKLTTISVVQSIFLVLLLDALFSILFTKLGI